MQKPVYLSVKIIRSFLLLINSVGILFTYILGQTALWWIFHISALFWKVVFPFHARSMPGKIKYIHIMCVILGVLLPLIPIITSMIKFGVELQNQYENSSLQYRSDMFFSGGLGFKPSRFPTILCTGSDPDAIFYSLLVPIDIILACGCTMLIIIFWSIHRVSVCLLCMPCVNEARVSKFI